MPDANPYDSSLVPIPERSDDALSGSAFANSILNLPLGQQREDKILEQYASGNVPAFMRSLCEVTVKVGNDSLTFFCLPDYICVGTDDDYFRTPVNPVTAQKVADLFNCMIPTRKMVDNIWKSSRKIAPAPLPPGAKMTTVEYFIQHDKVVAKQLAALSGFELGNLLDGHLKNVVISKALGSYPHNVIIYGWHQLNGVAIQGQNPKSHDSHYADYSHGIRLICKTGLLNGVSVDIAEVIKTDKLGLLSDEGPHQFVRYPT